MSTHRRLSLFWAVFFTLGSLLLILYAVGAAPGLFQAIGLRTPFPEMTTCHPFIMGFIKLFLLGTFGELLKFVIARRSLALDRVLQRAIVWGVYGLWFTLAFPAFSFAVDGLVDNDLWPADIPLISPALWLAFSKSLWINLLGMYALGMFVSHEYVNHLIASGWRSWGFGAFAEQAQKQFILAFLPRTLWFWIPAHTFTFAMPPVWRVFIAAILAVALGFFLSVGRRVGK